MYILNMPCTQIKTELECLVKLLDGKIYKEEEVAMEELHQYLIEDDGSWALGDNFLVFVQRVLRDVQAFSPDTRIHLIRTLAYAALKDDVIIILHQDRRDHTLMNFAQDIDKHSPEEQQAWAMFVSLLDSSDLVTPTDHALSTDLQSVRERWALRVAALHLRVGIQWPDHL